MKNKTLLYFIAIMLASLAQVMSDLYLPILPVMEKALQTTPHAVQFSIAAYIWGCAISQLFYGPISDAYGRRITLIVGLSIAVLGSIICYEAQHIGWLIFGRGLQGCGAGVGLTLSRAILRDTYHGKQLMKVMSYFAILNVGIMTSAPVLGALLLSWFDWHANFSFLLGYAIAIWFMVFFLLPETNAHKDKSKIKFEFIKKALLDLVKHPRYFYYALIIFCCYGAILVWITMSAMLLIKHRHMLPLHYAYVMLGIGAICVGMSLVNAKLIKVVSHKLIILFGAICMMSASALLIMLHNNLSIWAVILPIYLLIVGTSVVFPNGIANALTPFATIAGTAAAILGFLQIVGGAISSSIVSMYAMHSALDMGIFICILSIVSVLSSIKILLSK